MRFDETPRKDLLHSVGPKHEGMPSKQEALNRKVFDQIVSVCVFGGGGELGL